MKAWLSLLDWAGRVGAGPGDSPETLLQKRLTVALCAGTLPLTVGWSLIYLAAGAPLAAAVPGFYSLFTPLNIFSTRVRRLMCFSWRRRSEKSRSLPRNAVTWPSSPSSASMLRSSQR